ncbi:MAG TPA: ABC transporter ATP-binding protein [Candidatus Methanoculleus thermohydrogenotrophicum]|jgi:NitT/TauT family transport system ATP-binding protein|nr:ABC transporter ATP-binding protein [Candidatus Methanoculleus thermohydrogenotrophicum]NLM81569.1 ABC transporter ATP-binding protein [Candidatus Methanoculleus thermohydrogenotrophicum]HOB17074.1 ABC transporter ATP-binding protein [Candidatus Methanoculleus thermohydrogenotrophicum]HPZ37154.1 ABC transporter ATP-binding protein [Candidatus Methanoculleus thermohydrogenotrophicum]HQC90631.1 ABC transporter ATP-binding protein [Candidatus Methanoculleus thermohydrogenotrophicum]
MSGVTIQNLSKIFPKEDGTVTQALESVDLEIQDKEFVCLVGPSGCGKTTLLRIIAGLETATTGSVTVDGDAVTGPDPKRGMVFQEYSLFPWRRVIDNVSFGLEMKGVGKEERRQTADRYIEMVGLSQFRDAYPYELSGGMRQRVAIARALANDPDVLLMDEPFGALDAQTRNRMQKELLCLWKKTEKTIIFVTHSVDEAVYLSDRIVVLSPRPGTVREIIEIPWPRPRDRTSAGFAEVRRRVLRMIAENEDAG